jgi:hypothetical protein
VRALPWQVGDLTFYAESEFGFAVIGKHEMAAVFGLDEGTLEVYSWVAGRFTHSRRRENLSFSHHALLAAWGSDSEQDEWLDRAEAEGWSRDEFRSVLRARGHEATGGPHIGGDTPSRKRPASRKQRPIRSWRERIPPGARARARA